MIIAGCDLSMSCPAIVKFDTTKEYTFENIEIFYRIGLKKYQKQIANNILGEAIQPFETPEERWNNIAQWSISHTLDCDIVNIEGMSFGATSNSLAQIGEMAGVVKHYWYLNNIQIIVTPPTQNKKSFSGKGNASKGEMIDAAITKYNTDIPAIFELTGTNLHPVEDICDALGLMDSVYTTISNK